jgi:DUF1680 family protein
MNKKLYLLFLSSGIMLCTTAAYANGEHQAASPRPTLLSVSKYRPIVSTEAVEVSVPEGCVPRLPFQVWVTYSDGSGEYRQVRWQNSSPTREQAEASPQATPAGTAYTVKGFITGDNTTPSGYPLTARVTVVSRPWDVPSRKPVARTLPLDKVRIDGENRLTWNRDMDIDHLLSLDVRQQLYNYRDTYGLSTEGYPEADGWDSPTTKLKGHGSGHYMSALAFAFASCQDPEKKDALRHNIRTMVDELRQCQERTFVWDERLGRYWEARDFATEAELDTMKGAWKDFDTYKRQYRHYGYGYLNAIPAQHCVLIEKYSPYNNDNGVWAPYYSVHKQLAGLIDIATYIDDKDIAAKALLTAKDMGLWVWNRLHYRTYLKGDGSTEERRARPGNRYEMWNMYIAGEVGGMAESLARLSLMTDDTTERQRLLEAATYFDSPAFFDPLARNIDAIRTRHANQHIPMVTGALHVFEGSGKPYYYNLAQNFWNMIQGRYRYAMGGVGNGEMFRQPYSQITSMCGNVTNWGGEPRPEPTINETCCAYNLAKLTKDLNCYRPDDALYMDYYERVLYNQIVGSLNPHRYQVLYQYAVGLNASKPWGNETPQSTCCGGTGAENHVKYQEATYFVSDSTLWVALYMPTTAQWLEKGVSVSQQCQWPAERSTLRFTPAKGKLSASAFAVKLRVPYWATEGFDIRLNGKSIAKSYHPSSYAEIARRRWSRDDVVEVIMPFTKHIDFGPDKMSNAPERGKGSRDYTPQWAGTIMYGPLAMATTGISSWDEASFTLSPTLDEIVAGKPADGSTPADANLYTLKLGSHTFTPDYYADKDVTHYLRIDIAADPEAVKAAMTAMGTDADMTELKELAAIAQSRNDEQEAWQDMERKVPDYAPWAPHAFARMLTALQQARSIMDSKDASQKEIDHAVTELAAVINSMRPGNLPEPEDLDELNALMAEARKKKDSTDNRLNQALDYAAMVVRYVSDGSGTKDMIERATRQLADLLDK